MSGPKAPPCLRNGKDLSWLKILAEKQKTKDLPPWASCLDSSFISALETLHIWLQITTFARPKASTLYVHTDASGLASLQMNSFPQTAECWVHFPAL